MSDKFPLSAADYVILGVMLAISAAIGLYFGTFGGKQKTNDEYLFAGKNSPIFLVSFSLMSSFMAATTLIGIPSEMYIYGTGMAFMNIGFLLGPIVSSIVFIPIYFKTGVSTVHEYLERRFGKTTRRILSWIYLIQGNLLNAAFLYAPALALNAVTDLSIWMSATTIGMVCTFYCAVGGMKAVLWTDAFQSILMYTCLLAIVIKGTLDLGGVTNIFQSAYDGGRILLPTFKMNFSVRYTMWNVFLQSFITTAYCYGGNQLQVQRQLTLKNAKRSKIASLLSAPMLVAFHLLCCLCGIVIYAHFKSCDPVSSPMHPIQSLDQLLPYYISSTMKEYPGLPGLCIAGIFSASLSSISSLLNSMAAVTYEDIIRPLCPNFAGPVIVTKLASVCYGCLTVLLTFLIASLGNIVQATLVITGLIYGPIFGVFILAALTTTANEMGINIGVLAGFVTACCGTFMTNTKRYPTLQTNNCSYQMEFMENISSPVYSIYKPINFTDSITVNATENQQYSSDSSSISYMWITPLSLLVTICIGYFGSWMISYFRGSTKNTDIELLSPVRRWFCQENPIVKSDSSEKQIELESTIHM